MDGIFIGIDVGTQGTRVVCVDENGNVHAASEDIFTHDSTDIPEGWHQQNPEQWWNSTVLCLRKITSCVEIKKIRAISVSSTSGTLCFLDKNYQPLIPAIMYNDRRSEKEATHLNEKLRHLTDKMGYQFNSSYGLAKILWVKSHLPEIFEKTVRIVHAADYITGKLSGNFCVSDYTNVLKTGYDLIEGKWPDEIENVFGIPLTKLPEVVASGAVIGIINPECSDQTGIPSGIPIVAGMTDGCASQVSTGTVVPGQWNSTLGTTLVIKGVTKHILKDPAGRIYNHRHPDGYWLPGGASNTGGDCLAKKFDRKNWQYLDEKAADIVPTGKICWPLSGKGERFPFVNSEAQGFQVENCDEETLYAAYLEGVGYIEKLAYQTIEELGAIITDNIRIAGGATRSKIWNKIRASILNKTLLQPENPYAAYGAAILAASRTYYDNLQQACHAMVKIACEYPADKILVEQYHKLYQRFVEKLKEKHYI
ncbi:MAG TPA: FGGY-family carbohydrate kinase [bacterium]|nr:FGGY-family carbohydrate kinase [bacterium]HOL34764.1 FGGY-family carbohydrate kinase [bacterium]HPP08470.1 FGGY-family carbohydrate kinase [bacterium]